MAQELEDLLIKVDSEVGDLSGIESAIGALNSLAQFSTKATRGATSLEKMANSLTLLNRFGKSGFNADKTVQDIGKLKTALGSLADFSKDANKSIKQLENLGKALGSFKDIGKNLAGINDVTKGIGEMVNVLERLSNVEKNATKGINNLKNLGTALHSFNGLDENVKALNDVAMGLMSLGKATEMLKGYKKSDFAYLSNLGSGLKGLMESMGGTTRIWSTIGEVAHGIASLTEALKNTNDVNVGHIGAIAEELKKFNDPQITQNATRLNSTLNNLTSTFTALGQSSGLVHNTMDKLMMGFRDADKGFYTIRESIEAISLDLTDALKPVRNSDLFDTLERFKHLNDSYKYVGGLGQGLGSLISALDMLNGRDLQTYGLTQLLDYFKKLSTDNTVDDAIKQMEKMGSMAQPIAQLVNALKYTDLDDKNNVLSVLASQLNAFYKALPDNFDKFSWAFKEIKALIQLASDAESFGVSIPKDNVISQLGESLQGFKGFGDIKKLESFVRNMTSLVGDIIRYTNSINASKKGELEDALDVTPIVKVGEALEKMTGLENSLNTFTKFTATLHGLNKLGKFALDGLDITLSKLFATLEHVPEGRVEALKDLGSVTRALDRLKDVDPTQLNLIADALSKILLSLGGIQGSGNRISIRLDSNGIANFKEVVQETKTSWEDFEQQLTEDMANIDMSQLFNMSGSVRDLERQLNEVGRMIHSKMKQMQDELAKMQNTQRQNANYQDNPSYRTQLGKYTRLQEEIRQLQDIQTQLQDAIRNAPRFTDYTEGARYIHGLREEYQRYQEVMQRYRDRHHTPTEEISNGFRLMQNRMEEITEEIRQSETELQNMEQTMEGIAIRASDFADELERAERASQQSINEIGDGFGQFSGLLKGSKNGVLGSIGNVFDIFGKGLKSGTFQLSESSLASLSQLAGTLGRVAGAVSMVTAVVGVAVEIFKAWWNLMEKIKSAIGKFIQSLIQFAKNMRSVVVGAFNAVSGAISKVASVVRSGAEVITSALRKIGDFGNKIISIFAKIGGAVAPAVKGIKAVMLAVSPRFVKTLASADFQLKKILKQTHLLKSAIKVITRYFSMLSRMLMRKSITAFLNQMKQAFEDMVLFEMNADDAMLQLEYNVSIVFSELRRLANQVMAIFEPLINAMAVPAQSFLATLTAMAENMAKFMAIMTGQPYYLRAKRFYESYGKNVEDTAKKVRNLTNGLDELNILSATKDTDTYPTPEDMIENVPVDGFDFGLPALAEIIDKIVDFLMNIDWEALWDKIREFVDRIMDYFNYVLSRLDLAEWLGRTLANLINTIVVFLNELGERFDPKALADWISAFIINALNNINWDEINATVELWATKLAQFWNEIFANEELWDSIVNFIVNALNEITHYFDTFAKNFDFAQMAQQLTDSIAEILNGYDWEQLRSAVEGWIGGLVDFINTAIANKEFWKALGQAIENIINNVIIEAFTELARLDLVGLSDSLKTMINNAIDGIKWAELEQAVRTLATKLAQAFNDFFGDSQFLTNITTAIANFANIIIRAIDDFITTLKGYDIGKAIGDALVSGLGKIDWNTIFKIPADAINLLSDALRGLLDSIPEDFNLGTWLTEHLKITLEGIKWDELEKNISDLAKTISSWIDGLLKDEEFWKLAGETTGKVLRIGLDFIFEIFNVNGEDLGTAITNYINGLVSQVNIGSYISKTVDVLLNVVVALDTIFKGVDWATIGDQIAQGIVDAIKKIYDNRKLIAQTIEDAFAVFSTLVNKILVKMVNNGSFYQIGQTVGEIILAVIKGIAGFFDENLDVILAGMRQLGDSLAEFLRKNHNKIVKYLNKIIDALVEILDEFLNEKSELWHELMSILEELHIGELLGALIGKFLTELFEKLELNSSLTKALGEQLGDFFEEIGKALGRIGKKYIWRFFKGLAERLFLGGLYAPATFLKDLVKSLIFKDDGSAKESFFKKISDKISEWWNGEHFWDKWFKGKEETVDLPVTVEPTVEDDEFDWGDYFDDTKKVPIELEDPTLGTITAELIEAETIKVIDIFADKLHVGEIDSDMSGEHKMDDFFGGNEVNAEGGVLGAKRDAEFDKILARLLEVTEKITAPLLEIAENITTPLLTAEKIDTPLIDAKKIVTKLLNVTKKITTKLLEADKIWTKLLEVRDEIDTEKLVVDKKTTTKILEVDEITIKNNGIGLEADIQYFEKVVAQLFEAIRMIADELQVEDMNVQTLSVTSFITDFVAQTIDVDLITAQTLRLSDIFADTLTVGNINGNISGNGGYSGISSNYDYGFGDYYYEKPIFEKGERFSDLTGLAPSAEDFLDGIANSISSAYHETADTISMSIKTSFADNVVDGVTGVLENSGGGVAHYKMRDDYGNNSSAPSYNQSDGSYSVVSLDTDTAKYIRDYLMKEIGNEAGVYGLMGNLYAESGLKSNNLQDSGNKRLGLTDEEYTNKINKGGDFTDNIGYGLAQWTTDDRKQKLQDYLDGRSIDDLDGQLEYLVHELKTDFPDVWNTLKTATINYEASTAVLEGFEKPKNADDKISERSSYANQIANLLGDEPTDSVTIPDEPTPTADEPNLYEGFDEANVIGDKPSGTSSNGGYFSFLDDLPTLAEYRMAEVYNVIDKWLGRIYKLFKAFNVDDFLKNLLELELKDVDIAVNGSVEIINSLLEELIDLLKKLLKKGLECNCNCGGGISNIYEDIKRAIEDCGLSNPDDTHLVNNTNAKSKNTKAVEDLNNTMREMANCCSNNQGATNRLINAIGDWITCAGNTGHLDNNTKAKSANTKAVEGLNGTIADLNRNMGNFISNLQGGLSNVTCNCNCNCNCGNCAMGGGNNGGTTTNRSNPTYYDDNNQTADGGVISRNNTGDNGGSGTTGRNNTGDNGGGTTGRNNGNVYDPAGVLDGRLGGDRNIGNNNGADTVNRTSDPNYDQNNQTADGGVVDRTGDNTNPSTPTNNPTNNDTPTNNNSGDTNNTPTNNEDKNGDGVPDNLAPTFNPATGLTTFTDNEGNLYPEYGQRKVKGFGDDKDAEWATGWFKPWFDEEQEKKKKAEEEAKKRAEENQKKAEEAREKNNENTPAVIPYVVDENGYRTYSSDTYKELYDSENKAVEELRKKGKEYLDNINKYGTDEEKASAQNYYNSLMTNKGVMDKKPYEFNLEKLEDLSASATTNLLGEDLKEARLGANGGAYAIKDLIKTDAGKATLANALISDRDSLGYQIYWYSKGNGSANSAQAKDRITDEETINKIKDTIRAMGITEDMANFGTSNQNAYEAYKAVIDSSASDEDKENAKKYFQKYLAWKTSSNADSRTSNMKFYLEKLQELAGVSSSENSTEKTARQKELDEAVKSIENDDAYVSFGKDNYSYSSSKEHPVNEHFDRTKDMQWISDGLTVLRKFSVNAGKFVAQNEEEAKTLFDAWYPRFLAKGYQMGGIPNSGEIYVARENGTPEFVGSFGNRTAVANNDQIVTAVANGVSMANDRMVSAIQNQTNTLTNAIDRKDLNVQIGDRQIAEANNRGQKGLGNKFVD